MTRAESRAHDPWRYREEEEMGGLPVELLTLYAAVAHAAAPPAPLHRIEIAYLLAVGTHQPTPDPILLGPLLPSSLMLDAIV
jgi:hypothetical protein